MSVCVSGGWGGAIIMADISKAQSRKKVKPRTEKGGKERFLKGIKTFYLKVINIYGSELAILIANCKQGFKNFKNCN